MRNSVILFITVVLMLLIVPQCFAETVPAIIDNTQPQQTQAPAAQDQTPAQAQTPVQTQAPVQTQTPAVQPQGNVQYEPLPAGGTAGIRPVSPEEFAGRVNNMIDKMYTAASPVTDAVAKIMLAVAGLAALVVLFSGMKLFQKVVCAVLSIGFGLLLFYGAPYIVGLVKGLAQYATR